MPGNSFTFANDMPSMLAELTGAEVVYHTRGGARLAEQLNPNTKMGAKTIAALEEEFWDYVVLQEMSNGPITSRDAFLKNVELEQKDPPPVLYHGTGEKYVSSIDAQGLIPKSRLYVHLSSDTETAKKVDSRHGRPVIYTVDSGQMAAAGYAFYLSVNHVWLTKEVPVKYLHKEI